MTPLLARIAVADVPFVADRLYTYLVPEELRGSVRPGMRVSVPFGRGNRSAEGFVLETEEREAQEKLKPLRAVLDREPLMDETLLRLVKWMKARYFCTYYDAVKTILPAGVWLRYEERWRLADGVDAEAASEGYGVEDAEFLLLHALAALGEADTEKLRRTAGAETEDALRRLQARGLICAEQRAGQKVQDKSVRMYCLAVSGEDAAAYIERKRASASVRCAALELLCAAETLSAGELAYYTGATRRTLAALEKEGLVRSCEQELLRVRSYDAAPPSEPIVLSDEQQRAFEGLNALAAAETAGCALLHGVTASGKTQVYIRLIEETLRRGKNALLLVPEIALTPQMTAKFSAYFGDRVAMLHSALRLTERYDQWKRIRRGDVRVVIGTRSAVFAPLTRLGLVIMDEEQEGTYLSENPPRYHTRDIAQFLCAQHGALLVLGSATPTVETSYFARTGRYQVFSLARRYNEQSLPQVLIADMRQELRAGNDGLITAPLRREMEKNLARGEQTILFLNRRGSARMLICGECGAVPECPNCSVPMTYHSANGRLMCHYCGHSERAPARCPQCGGLLKHFGAGTQKVEEELGTLFPGTRVLRMDSDTVGATHSHEKLLDTFERQRVPILLGTQMVAKGLDFENVTLVGVLAADLSLYVDNYRAAERTFSMLTQVVGRAGRGSKEGRAVIQTFTPENDVIRAAAAQDYEAFYQSEIRMRRARRYPPFADLFTLTVTGADEEQVLYAVGALHTALKLRFEKELPEVDVLGPAAAPVVRVNNRFRYRIFLVGRNDGALRRVLSEFLYAFHLHKENRGLDLFADCNALT